MEEAIHRDEKHGLDVIPSGTLPPDPTWILQSEETKQILAELKSKYDFVIFDLPPVVTVTDAVIVADSLDGYLMVVRHGRTKLSDVDRMISQLRLANSRIIGFVENQAINESDPNLKDYSYKKKTKGPKLFSFLEKKRKDADKSKTSSQSTAKAPDAGKKTAETEKPASKKHNSKK